MTSAGVENTFNVDIATVSLLDYLREDRRPTIVFSAQGGVAATGSDVTWALDYSNPAFNNFLTSAKQLGTCGDSDYATFIRDADHAYAARFEFAGQFWRVRYFRGRWRIVYCEDELDDGAVSRGAALDKVVDQTASPPPRDAQNMMPSRGLSEDTVGTTNTSSSSSYSTPTTQFRSVSKRSSLADFGDAKEIIDWTQYDVQQELPAFIQFFKHHDWASTNIGPITDWPLGLRQAVVKMMSTPGQCRPLQGSTFCFDT